MIKLSYRNLHKSFINKTCPDRNGLILRDYFNYENFRKEINEYFDENLYSLSDPINKKYINIPLINSNDGSDTKAYAILYVPYRNNNVIKLGHFHSVFPHNCEIKQNNFYVPEFMDIDIVVLYASKISFNEVGEITAVKLGFELEWKIPIFHLGCISYT